jgi:hypothetical protein
MTAMVYGPGTAKKEKGRIVSEGMGGFLCPPGHPEHSYSVETDLRRRPWNRGRMSLSCAVDCEWLDPVTREQAKVKLGLWYDYGRPCLGLPEMQDWIRQILGYFRGCYRNPEAGAEQWNAGNLIIDQDRNPLDKPEDHAGVNLIRRYYPEYAPTAEEFAGAYWGKKPEKS